MAAMGRAKTLERNQDISIIWEKKGTWRAVYQLRELRAREKHTLDLTGREEDVGCGTPGTTFLVAVGGGSPSDLDEMEAERTTRRKKRRNEKLRKPSRTDLSYLLKAGKTYNGAGNVKSPGTKAGGAASPALGMPFCRGVR